MQSGLAEQAPHLSQCWLGARFGWKRKIALVHEIFTLASPNGQPAAQLERLR